MPKHEPAPGGRTVGGRTPDPRQMRAVQRHLGRELGALYDRLASFPDARLSDLARRLDAKAGTEGTER